MAKYYVDGYTTPDGVNSGDAVREWQKRLGVKVDGIWGRETQSAYDKYMSAQGSKSGCFDWDAAGERIRGQLEEILRPAVDAAIKRRKESTEAQKAEIDADAASRGMESSTYVTDVKAKANSAEQDDVESYETGYNQTLAQTLQKMLDEAYDDYTAEKARQESLALEREKMRQSERQFEKSLAAQSRRSSGNSGSSENTDGQRKKGLGKGYSVEDYADYIRGLTYLDRKNLFNSSDVYWSIIREQIIDDIGTKEYSKFVNQYYDEVPHDVPRNDDDESGETKFYIV